MKLDLAVLYSMNLAIPSHLHHRARWVMSPETKELIKAEAERTMPMPPITPSPLIVGAVTPVDVLIGIPVRLVAGFEGIALEIEGVVQPDGTLQ